MALKVSGKVIATDKEGYLKDHFEWNQEIAELIAKKDNINLNQNHWEIIYLLRDFYNEFDMSPAMRALVKYTALKLGKEKGNSIYLMQLFPPSPAKIASKLAGLPRPANCL